MTPEGWEQVTEGEGVATRPSILDFDNPVPLSMNTNLQMGWQTHFGDCLRVMKEYEDETFNAIVTDPPYGIDFQSNHRRATPKLNKIANDKLPFIWWLYDAYRLTKPGGQLICFCRWDVQEAFVKAIEWAGYTIKSQAIWDRDIHGSGDLDGSFGPQHDVIWHAVKGEGAMLYGVRPKSVIRIQRPQGAALLHPNEKPVALMRYLVRAVCPPEGLVLDPFMGSGSTGVACVQEGRQFVGIELLEEHYNTSMSRLTQGQTAMQLEGV